jgi:pimeloyl-ACP methyl ester carboxylesterase
MTAHYLPRRPAETFTRQVRGIAHHFTCWPGEAGSAPVFLLHGFMDCGATFQFVADAMSSPRTLLAPDWRGFGQSGWNPQGYWYPDYFADLDAMLDDLSPGLPADLVGHSMGGNIAMVYAGLRPDRVRRVVSLEGFGLPGAPPQLAPGRYRDWLDQWRQPEPASVFPGIEVFAGVLRKRNPRLSPGRADFVARAWSEPLPDGRVRTRFDPGHKRVNPVLYRREEAEACWAEVRAPLLYVAGAESDFLSRLGGAGDPQRMRELIPQLEPRIIAAAGHMVHHEQPEAVAALVEEFLGRQPLILGSSPNGSGTDSTGRPT